MTESAPKPPESFNPQEVVDEFAGIGVKKFTEEDEYSSWELRYRLLMRKINLALEKFTQHVGEIRGNRDEAVREQFFKARANLESLKRRVEEVVADFKKGTSEPPKS